MKPRIFSTSIVAGFLLLVFSVTQANPMDESLLRSSLTDRHGLLIRRGNGTVNEMGYHCAPENGRTSGIVGSKTSHGR